MWCSAHAPEGTTASGTLVGLKADEISRWEPGCSWWLDAYDALTWQRYRSPESYEVAAQILAQDDSRFDPPALATFLAIAPEDLQMITERDHDADLSC